MNSYQNKETIYFKCGYAQFILLKNTHNQIKLRDLKHIFYYLSNILVTKNSLSSFLQDSLMNS